jgi:rfaE bifunctional protein kinase chain/domain
VKPEKSTHLANIIPNLAGCRVMVVGDVILDEYITGWATRMSREAPIPVLEFQKQEHIPGGAANPSMNIAALGSSAVQIGVVGQDADGDTLRKILQSRGIDTSGLVVDPSRPTTCKTRVMAQMGLRFPQQVARIDKIDRTAIRADIERDVITRLLDLSHNVNALMVSDYLSGFLTPAIVDVVRYIRTQRSFIATADAQGEFEKYHGFDLVKCNANEASEYVGRRLKTGDDFAQAGREIVERLDMRGGMLITRGSEGVTLVQKNGEVVHIPASHIEDVYDTVGAGDTAIAVITLALVANASYVDAAELANLAAGIVVRKVGNYAPSREELIEALSEHEV